MQFGVTFDNESGYRTNRLYQTPDPNPNPSPSAQWSISPITH